MNAIIIFFVSKDNNLHFFDTLIIFVGTGNFNNNTTFETFNFGGNFDV